MTTWWDKLAEAQMKWNKQMSEAINLNKQKGDINMSNTRRASVGIITALQDNLYDIKKDRDHMIGLIEDLKKPELSTKNKLEIKLEIVNYYDFTGSIIHEYNLKETLDEWMSIRGEMERLSTEIVGQIEDGEV